jgi:hypothetical protein
LAGGLGTNRSEVFLSGSFDKAFITELIIGEVQMDSLSEFQFFIVESSKNDMVVYFTNVCELT